MRPLLLLALLLPAAPAAGQTYTWTGGDAGLWSDPDNWDNGVPTSGDGVTLVGPLGTNDLPGLAVGELHGTDAGWDGGRLTVTRRLSFSESQVGLPPFPFGGDSPLRLAGDVTVATTDLGPTDPEARYGFTPQLRDVELDGRLTIDGHVQVLQMTGRGSLTVPAGAALHGPYDGFGLDSSVVLDAVDVAGTLDARLIGLGGTGTLDASGGLLAVGSAVNTLGVAFSNRMTVDGNLRLGDWANGGAEARDDPLGNPDPFERVDVSGTLDLTTARLLYDPVRVYYDSAADVFDPPLPPPTLADSFVIATYGNRVGAFPRDRLDVLLDDGVDYADILVPGRIVYTSGENDGPGEVLVVLPEPATATLALAGCLFLGRRW